MDSHCVAGDDQTNDIPVVRIDYGFFKDRDPAGDPVESAPILASKGMPDLWISSAMVLRKGTDEYAIERLAAEIFGVGSAEVMVQSDQEPSIIALKEAAASRVRPDGVKVIHEESAVADSRGNGFTESTVKEAKNLARTLLSSLNAQYDHTFGGADAVVVWLVRYCGRMLNRFRRGTDGKTVYERRKGRAFQRKVPPFGEKILYVPAPGRHGQVSWPSSG